MTIQVDHSRLDEGEGSENTFITWKARWHKSCYDQDLFNSTKLKRAEKRQTLESEQNTSWWKVYKFSFAGISRQLWYMLFLWRVFYTGDLLVLEAKYHAPCLASYKKGERVKEEGEEDETSPWILEGIVLAELVSFSEESRTAELSVFRLTELVDKYTSRLKQLGENTPARIHTTCLKDRILSQIPALKEHKQGCDVFFGHQNGSCQCTTESS